MPKKNSSYTVDVVVPCFNEEDILPNTIGRIVDYMSDMVADPGHEVNSFRLILVDDGSSDATWKIIRQAAENDLRIVGLKLTRNFGHQAALIAGLEAVTADACISMDADLQDDPDAIGRMLDAYEAGNDMALGVRIDRSTDTAFKRVSARFYYFLLNRLGVDVVQNHADYRLMSKRALASLLSHGEANLYLRGLIPTLGYNVALVPYERKSRAAGKSKYTIRKMFRLATDGITSFSIRPLRIVAILGLFVSFLSIVVAGYVFAVRILYPDAVVAGWASTLLPLMLISGIQILCVGIIGEYIGKIYIEVKKRPRYIIDNEDLQ